MKKVAVLFLFLMLFSLASAVEIKLSKEVYQPSETLQAEIYGNFLDIIQPENIHFYRERNVPVEYDILKLNDKYLIYALLPYQEGNYTLTIEGIRYKEENVVADKEIIKQFKIEKSNESYLIFDPGFVVAREDFYIELESYQNINLEASFLDQKKSVELSEGRKKKVYFSIEGVANYTQANISFLSYSVPVFIFPNKSEEVIEEAPNFRFSPLEIEASIFTGEKVSFIVYLTNFGINNITNISLTFNLTNINFTFNSSEIEYVIEPDFIDLLNSKSHEFINLSFTAKKKGQFLGKIYATSNNSSAELDVYLESTDNRSEINNTNKSTGYIPEKTCSESGGKIWSVENGETCTNVSVLKVDGYCCMGECKKEEPKGSSNWIYGLIILLALIGGFIGLSFFLKKRKGSTDVLKKREEKFNERIFVPGSEVRGSLSKI